MVDEFFINKVIEFIMYSECFGDNIENFVFKIID